MIEDVLWKLFRKSLSDNLYETLRVSKFGRPYKYLSLETYHNIYKHYCEHNVNFSDKIVMEIGSGYQYYTAFYFLMAGARQVYLVDPVFHTINENIINEQKHEFLKNYPDKNKNIDVNKVTVLSSLSDIPDNKNGTIDVICSHLVLEHIHDLDNYFIQAYKLLQKGGQCYNFVDLTDHTYHIFDSRKLTKWIFNRRMLYHLKYSDRMYSCLSDKRTWVNRLLFPAYLAKAENIGFKDCKQKLFSSSKTKIHTDVLEKMAKTEFNEKQLYISHFSLMLLK